MDRFSDFEKYMEDCSLSQNTIKSYLYDIKIFIDFFKEKYDEDITTVEHIVVREYIKELRNQERKAETINRKIAAIRMYNCYCVDKGLQKEIVILDKDYIKIQERLTSPSAPTEKEVYKLKRISAENNKRDYTIIALLSSTGIRVSELVNIKLSDVDFDKNYIVIKGKGNKVRIVIMVDIVAEIIKDYLKEREEQGTIDKNKYLFIGRQEVEKNKPLHRSTINKILKTYSEMLSIYINPHKLRHFFCTEHLVKKKTLTSEQVAAIVGHNSINTTKKYTKIDMEDIKKSLNAVL